MKRRPNIRTCVHGVLAAFFFLGTGCALEMGDRSGFPPDPPNPPGATGGTGDDGSWNGENNKLTRLRVLSTFYAFVGLARNVQTQGPGSSTFFDRSNCSQTNLHCLALRDLTEEEYVLAKRIARAALQQIIDLATEGPGQLKITVAQGPMYLTPPAPPELVGQRQWMMANPQLVEIKVDPDALMIDDIYFDAAVAHELMHLVRLPDANGNLTQNRLGLADEAMASALGSGFKLALAAQPPPLVFDTTLNYLGSSNQTCKNGIACVPLPGPASPTGSLIQPDGKIVVAGTHTVPAIPNVPAHPEMFVARFNADGTLDTTFNGNGIVRYGVGAAPTHGGPIVRLPSGRLLVLGLYVAPGTNGRTKLAFLMLEANGARATNYGQNNNGVHFEPDWLVLKSNGKTWRYDLNGVYTALSLADGSVLAGGRSCSRQLSNGSTVTYCAPLLLKLTNLGAFDPEFGNTRWRPGGGVATVLPVMERGNMKLTRLALAPNGSIYAIGTRSGGDYPLMLRYSADGIADATFGNADGWAGGNIAVYSDLAVSTTNVLVSGRSSSVANTIRYSYDVKQVDVSWGVNGIRAMPTSYLGFQMLSYSQGRTLVGIARTNSPLVSFALLDIEGNFLVFQSGTNTTAASIRDVTYPWKAVPFSMHVQPRDGKIVIVGSSNAGSVFISRVWPLWE